MTTLTEPRRLQDMMEYETDQRYTRRAATFRHSTGSPTSFPVGTPLVISTTKYVPASGDAVDAILIQPVHLLATATDLANVAILKKGPAIVNKQEIDLVSGHETANVAAIEALGIRVIDEPAEQSSGSGDD